MRLAARQTRRDFPGGEERRLGVVDGADEAAIVARAAALLQLAAGAGEKGERVLLQPSLGRRGDDEAVGEGGGH